MSIVNFEVKKPLEQKIKNAIKDYGFSSKAEFFRFTAINFLNQEKQKISEEEKLSYLSTELRKVLIKKLPPKSPSLKKQLSDI